MVLIYHDFYRRKCSIFGRLWFSCTNFGDHLKKSKLQDRFDWLCVHKILSNIEHFRKYYPKRDKHKENLKPCLIGRFCFCCVDVWIVSLYQQKQLVP